MKITDKIEQIETKIIEIEITKEEWEKHKDDDFDGLEALDWLYEETGCEYLNKNHISYFWHEENECNILLDDTGEYILLRVVAG